MRDRLPWANCGLVFVLLLPAATLGAVGTFGYGDIQIKIISEPLGEARHGYAVYTVKIDNTSKQKKHTVTIVMPGESISAGDNVIRALRRTVEVGPNDFAVVPLYRPPAPGIYGAKAQVFID